MDRIENDASNNYSIVSCVFVAAVTFLQSRFLATIGGYTYKHTDKWEGFMKCAVEMGSRAMIHIPSFIKIGSKVHGGKGNTHIYRQHGDLISLLYFLSKQ
jgi:hypothetical protein